jgi:site-specific recombinase XerD
MGTQLITNIEQAMLSVLDNYQMERLRQVLRHELHGLRQSDAEATDVTADEYNARVAASFIDAKRIEGCSERTLIFYNATIAAMTRAVGKHVKHMTTDDLRSYLGQYHQGGASKVTTDNVRRNLNSFFTWLEAEDYIIKSPMRRIHRIKSGKIYKSGYTDEELEKIRSTCDCQRDAAIINMLASTGMRVGELVKLNRADIDFENRECIVCGKGNKERKVFFDARAKMLLAEYLASRTDENPALFVSLQPPYKRFNIGGVETRLRTIGERLGIAKAHPHKFRRTLATMAIDKGMPLEQVQNMLGHQNSDTTLLYAMVKQENVKTSHRKYLS